MAAEETALFGGLLGIALQTGLSISGNPKEGAYFGSLLDSAFGQVSQFQEAKHLEGRTAVDNTTSAVSTPPTGTTAATAAAQAAREAKAGKSIFSQTWVWVLGIGTVAVIGVFGWRMR